MNSTEFQERLRGEGYAVEESAIAPNTSRAAHAHPFDVAALVLSGAITLTCGDDKRTYRPGDRFTMAAGTMHAEDVGADGVRYLVGRRS